MAWVRQESSPHPHGNYVTLKRGGGNFFQNNQFCIITMIWLLWIPLRPYLFLITLEGGNKLKKQILKGSDNCV
jgi:hypothetical protein